MKFVVKILKICTVFIAVLFLFFWLWYFFLIGLVDDPQVLGKAAPTMSKEETLALMNYHGVKIIQVKNGEWTFERDRQTIPLRRGNLLRSKN